MFQRKILASLSALLFAASMAITGPAFAGSTTGTMQSNVTLAPACTTIVTVPLSWSTTVLQSGGAFAAGYYHINCTYKTPYSMAINAGSTAGATTSAHLMTDSSGDLLHYTLYTDYTMTTVWTTQTHTGTGQGSIADAQSVYAKIDAGQTPLPGTYTDTLTLTTTF